jgi:hypothetical protein
MTGVSSPERHLPKSVIQLPTPPTSVSSSKISSPSTHLYGSSSSSNVGSSQRYNNRTPYSIFMSPHPNISVKKEPGSSGRSLSSLLSFNDTDNSSSRWPRANAQHSPSAFSSSQDSIAIERRTSPPLFSFPTPPSSPPGLRHLEMTPVPTDNDQTKLSERGLPSSPVPPIPPPPEIQALLDSQTSQKPILLVLSQASNIRLPFYLDEEYAYSFLGCWYITNIDCSVCWNSLIQ